MMNENRRSIQDVLVNYARANLIATKAIIHKLPRLSDHLKYDIYILREDLTGFGLGGNKTRKLEFLVGDAISKRANCLCTIKDTSFSRNAAAAGKAYDLDVYVVLAGSKSSQNSNSLAFFEQYDCKLLYAPNSDWKILSDTYRKLVDSLKTEGKVVYELHPGGSDSIGALGYVDVFDQIQMYSQATDTPFENIIFSSSSAGTQAGLCIGQCISGYESLITGISASRNKDEQRNIVKDLSISTSRMLGIEFHENRIVVDDKFVGPGYALPSVEGKKAAKLFAQKEGILLDYVYTGKAAAALIEYSEKKTFKNGNVLFIHTGGNSGLYY
jgi:1-aminocyclopropane-1-carboxylate deaminase/D-cysteine desulfhydrase-like pyridoxal-dependent ACC family enzyme